MEYTIKQLADLSGLSTRALRYYDQIDLLKPSYTDQNNYRIYEQDQINRLQQIMFYKELDFPLSKIKRIMDDADYSGLAALKSQQKNLISKKKHIEKLLTNIELTIKDYGENNMTDSEKFRAFKKEQLEKNETIYGQELRNKYDEEEISSSKQNFAKLTEQDYQAMTKIEEQLIQDLKTYSQHPDLTSELAKNIYQEHKEWLEFTWSKYSKEAHRGLVEMYLADKRFADYYNKRAHQDVVRYLYDVVYHYTK